LGLDEKLNNLSLQETVALVFAHLSDPQEQQAEKV